MPTYQHNNYDHKKLIERIAHLNTVPEDATEFADWIRAGEHLSLLRKNAKENELIVDASGEYIYLEIYSVVVSEDSLSQVDQDDLLLWHFDLPSVCASYTRGGGRDDVWIERDYLNQWGPKTLEDVRPLVFAREFVGWKGRGRVYYEVPHEYSHLTEIHWRPEERAYCRFDENGDLQHVVSITSKEDRGSVALISFRREQLEQYLAASNSILIRKFNFTLLRQGNDFEFTDWPDDPEKVFKESDSFFYRQKVDAGKAAYTQGIQIIRPSRQKSEIFSQMRDGWAGDKDRQHVDFVARDWRNKLVANISTDPTATTNYFEASENSLPFELSAAFFRPEVLQKYKADRDKYTIDEEIRSISCRGGWRLRSYDINEAGQVHVYICDLRHLPFQEKTYWKSFNEEPKAGISQRALINDFQGEPSDIIDPLQNIKSILRRWAKSDLEWWKLRDEMLIEQANTPRTSSRDEWAQAFGALSNLVIEGFQVKVIRKRLDETGICFKKEERSIALFEKLLNGHPTLANGRGLHGLREVQAIRSKVAAHYGGSEADKIVRDALQEHGRYTVHFESVCRTVIHELNVIERAFS